MRFMIIVKSTPEIEAGTVPTGDMTKMLEDMGKYNEELVKAGVMLAGEGLHPSSNGARVRFSGGSTSVVDGPFTEAKELVAGYWLWEVSSREEAIEWVKRCPADPNVDSVIEIRQVMETEDFGDEMTPELREKEARLRAQTAQA